MAIQIDKNKLRTTPLEVELQWIINTNKVELEHLRYYSQRQQDFWEWYEKTHNETNNELWDEFEKWEEETNLSDKKNNDDKDKDNMYAF
jgi:hypothetical protein